jgi:uncharacterized repeat protein (TIGR01451 family)
MKTTIRFGYFLVIFGMIWGYGMAQVTPPEKEWDKTIGGYDRDILYAMLPTNDGGYLLGGFSNSHATGDKTEGNKGIYFNYWVVKIDAQGNKIWDKTLGGNNEVFRTMIATHDGGYLLGGDSDFDMMGDKSENSKGESDYWLIKIDAQGNKIWDKTLGGSGEEQLNVMLPTSDGGYLLVGSSLSDTGGDKSENSKGNYDCWLVKVDAQGNKIWDKTLGGSGGDFLQTMIFSSNGGYLLGGYSESNQGGDKSENSKGSVDYWIVKIDATGNKIWDKTLGGNSSDNLRTMLPTQDGGYLLGGESYSNQGGDKSENSKGEFDYWIVKIDETGNKQWDKTLGGSSTDVLYDMLPTPDGGYVLGGGSYSSISGDKNENNRGNIDYWLVKVDENGNKIWDKTLGGNKEDNLYSVLLTPDRGYLLAGWSNSDKAEDKTEDTKDYEYCKSTLCGDYWIVKLSPENPNKIQGTLYQNFNQNCLQETPEKGLSGWTVKAISQNGEEYFANTNSEGKYTLYLPQGTFTLSQIPPYSSDVLQYTQTCPIQPHTVTFSGLGETKSGFDFANQITECSLLKVDVTSNRRRRCFRNTTTLSYSNAGLADAENVVLKVEFPEYVLPLQSSVAWTRKVGNTLEFDLGLVKVGENKRISIIDSVACVAGIRGLSQCTKATISPRNTCVQPNPQWNGASLEVKAKCLVLFDPLVLFTVRNTGSANMNQAAKYRIYSNNTLIFQDQLQLAKGDSLVLELPTEGKSMHIEVEQVPFHPDNQVVTASNEGCRKTGQAFSAGFAGQFPPADENLATETDCQNIIDSFDPNDKQVSPLGFTENHYVKPNTELEYLIRFQNTGTAEAVNISVVDTLSTDLDMETFHLMSTSHPSELQIENIAGKQVLKWHFKNINLPDSTHNEPQSHGYIKFKIKHKTGIAEGTIIQNFADIYFDFNEPVRTNTTVSNITDYQFPQALVDFCSMVRKAQAGENQTICKSETTLSGNVPNVGTGKWTVVQGSGSFEDENDPQTPVTGLAYGENILEWNITSEKCNSQSQVKITRLHEPSVANAGTKQEVCSNATNLQAQTPEYGQGTWKVLQGTASIANLHHPQSQVSNLGIGENILVWKVGNDLCDSTQSQVIIHRYQSPSQAVAGNPQIICGSETNLQAQTPTVGKGKWTLLSGSAQIQEPNNPQSKLQNIALGEHILVWKVGNGVCDSTQSQVKITRLAILQASVSIVSDIQEAVCLGTTFTFTATGFNGGNNPIYNWKVNGVKKGANNPVFSINTLQNGDKVKLEMISAETCVTPSVAISNEITISIKPQAPKPNIEFLPERQLQSTVEGTSYDWFYAGNLLNEHSRSIAYTENTEGNYQVKVWWDDCVSAISEVFNTRISAIDSPSALGNISLYPNPHQGDFTLKITQAKGKNLALSIYTPSGQKVWEQSYQQIGDTFEQNIQLQGLPKGMYLLQIQSEKGRVVKQLVVW